MVLCVTATSPLQQARRWLGHAEHQPGQRWLAVDCLPLLFASCPTSHPISNKVEAQYTAVSSRWSDSVPLTCAVTAVETVAYGAFSSLDIRNDSAIESILNWMTSTPPALCPVYPWVFYLVSRFTLVISNIHTVMNCLELSNEYVLCTKPVQVAFVKLRR